MKKLDPKARILFLKIRYFFFGMFTMLFILFFIASNVDFSSFEINFSFFIPFSFLFGIWLFFFQAKLSVREFSYGLNEEGLVIEKGIIFHRKTIIPYEKISDVTITRSIHPALYIVRIYTTTIPPVFYNIISIFTSYFLYKIKGLSNEEALSLQDQLIKKIKVL